MTNKDFFSLKQHFYAKQHAPRPIYQGKRHAKGRAKHVGVVLKHSRVVPQVGLEVQHFQRQRN